MAPRPPQLAGLWLVRNILLGLPGVYPLEDRLCALLAAHFRVGPRLTHFCAEETGGGGRCVTQGELLGEHDVRRDRRPGAQIRRGGQDDSLSRHASDGDG